MKYTWHTTKKPSNRFLLVKVIYLLFYFTSNSQPKTIHIWQIDKKEIMPFLYRLHKLECQLALVGSLHILADIINSKNKNAFILCIWTLYSMTCFVRTVKLGFESYIVLNKPIKCMLNKIVVNCMCKFTVKRSPWYFLALNCFQTWCFAGRSQPEKLHSLSYIHSHFSFKVLTIYL